MNTSSPSSADHFIEGRRVEGFPVGYYYLHPDVSINYQMNRFSTGEADMIDEMRAIAPKIHDYKDYTREFLALAQDALGRGEKLKGALYLRSAEFYMFDDDPRKQDSRRQFLQLMREYYGFADNDHFEVPYETTVLSAFRAAPPQPKGTIVIFGNSSGEPTSVSFRDFAEHPNARIQGFSYFTSEAEDRFAPDLALLSWLVSDGSLKPVLVEHSWRDIAKVGPELRDRHIAGKAVFRIDQT